MDIIQVCVKISFEQKMEGLARPGFFFGIVVSEFYYP